MGHERQVNESFGFNGILTDDSDDVDDDLHVGQYDLFHLPSAQCSVVLLMHFCVHCFSTS